MATRSRLYVLATAVLAVLAAAAPQTVVAAQLEVVGEQKWTHEDSPLSGLHRVMFTADGKSLITAGYFCVRLWDVGGNEPKQRAARAKIGGLGRHGIWDAAVSPDGRRVAVGGDKILYLYDVSDGDLKEWAVRKDQAGAVRSLSFAPDGKLLASGSDDRTVRIYDLGGAKPGERGAFRPEKAGSAMISLRFLTDGKSLLFAYQGGSGNVGIADVTPTDPKVGRALTEKNVHRATISHDGKRIALFSAAAVKLYEADGATFKLRTTFKGHTKQGMGLSFSPDSKLLASAGKDEKCIVWDVASGQPLLTKIYSGDVEDVAFAPVQAAAREYRLAVPTHQRQVHLYTLRLK
jgi:WD40 repeat protein